MADIQVKLYKTKIESDGTPKGVSNAENGGLILAVNDKYSPSYGRIYFKNPYGGDYGTDGAVFEVGTNVSKLDVYGSFRNGESGPTYNRHAFLYKQGLFIKDNSDSITYASIQSDNGNIFTKGNIQAEREIYALETQGDKDYYTAMCGDVFAAGTGHNYYNNRTVIIDGRGDRQRILIGQKTPGTGINVDTPTTARIGINEVVTSGGVPYDGCIRSTGGFIYTTDNNCWAALAGDYIGGGKGLLPGYSNTSFRINAETGVFTTRQYDGESGSIKIGANTTKAIYAPTQTLTDVAGIHIDHISSGTGGISLSGGAGNVYPQILVFNTGAPEVDNIYVAIGGVEGRVYAQGFTTNINNNRSHAGGADTIWVPSGGLYALHYWYGGVTQTCFVYVPQRLGSESGSTHYCGFVADARASTGRVYFTGAMAGEALDDGRFAIYQSGSLSNGGKVTLISADSIVRLGGSYM